MARERSDTHRPDAPSRDDRRLGSPRGDAYALREKLPDPTACPACGALYRDGRWIWGSPPADAHRTLCPACRRVEDDLPAGLVSVEGAFAADHRDEIVGLVRNLEEREQREHPLKRIIRISEPEEGGLEIATTDAHLARGIGKALHHAYEGELEAPFTDEENLVRVRWSR
jgi:hypothetical protein